MKKPCKSCVGNKKSLSGTISKVLKLGATTKSTTNVVKKNVVITGDINTTPPRLSLSPILLALDSNKYKNIGRLEFPSRS
jgi:hypothetical protein